MVLMCEGLGDGIRVLVGQACEEAILIVGLRDFGGLLCVLVLGLFKEACLGPLEDEAFISTEIWIEYTNLETPVTFLLNLGH